MSYKLVRAPDNYPGKTYTIGKTKWVQKHVLEYWKFSGDYPEFWESIHHVDGDTENDSRENLKKMNTREHISKHSKESQPKKFIELICTQCGKSFTRAYNQVVTPISRGRTNFYCSRDCLYSHQES